MTPSKPVTTEDRSLRVRRPISSPASPKLAHNAFVATAKKVHKSATAASSEIVSHDVNNTKQTTGVVITGAEMSKNYKQLSICEDFLVKRAALSCENCKAVGTHVMNGSKPAEAW